MFVVDACLYIKLFINEEYSDTSKDFFNYCFQNDLTVYIPDIFRYEVFHTILKNKGDISKVRKMLEMNLSSGFEIFTPDTHTWDIAIEIAQS